MKPSPRVLLLWSLIVAVPAATLDLNDAQLGYVAGSGVALLDAGATLAGADFSTGSPLTIVVTITSGLVLGEDLVQIRAAGTVSVASGEVSVSGTVIGPYSGGAGGTPLSITITPGTDAALVQTLVRALAYHNLAGSGASATTRVIQVTVSDQGGPVSDQRTVAVGPGNAVPALTIGGTLAAPRTARVALDTTLLSATDAEDAAHELTYELGSLPEHGNLLLTNTDLAGDLTTTVILGGGLTTFSQADIDAGRVRYDHLGGPATSDGFTLRVRDGDGAATPLTALSISITGTMANPSLTLPGGALTCTEQAPAVAMDPAAPVTLGVALSDGDSLHFRRGELVVRLVGADGAAAATAGDTISLRAANGQSPSPTQSGYVCVVGSAIYIRHAASADPLPTIGTGTSPDQLLGTIDATDDGSAGRPLRIRFDSTVLRDEADQAMPAGDRIVSESEVVTPTAVAHLIANLQLSYPGDAPPAGPRFMAITLSEGTPNTASTVTQRAIEVVPVNDPPGFSPAGPLALTAVVGRPLIVTLAASDPDLPSGAALGYRLASPVAGVVLDAASGALNWVPPDDTAIVLDLIAQDEHGADSAPLHLTIQPSTGVTGDPPYIVSDPLVEIGEGDLIFHPFTIAPPAGTVLSVAVQVVGDHPPGAVLAAVSLDELSWTLTAPGVPRPADGIYTFGLRVEVTTGAGINVGYQPFTLVVIGVGGSN